MQTLLRDSKYTQHPKSSKSLCTKEMCINYLTQFPMLVIVTLQRVRLVFTNSDISIFFFHLVFVCEWVKLTNLHSFALTRNKSVNFFGFLLIEGRTITLALVCLRLQKLRNLSDVLMDRACRQERITQCQWVYQKVPQALFKCLSVQLNRAHTQQNKAEII